MDFKQFCEAICNQAESLDFQIIETKEIAYGKQIKINHRCGLKKDIISLNLYYSTKKKGFSLVSGAKKDHPYKEKIDIIVDYSYDIQDLHLPVKEKEPLKIKTAKECEEIADSSWQTYGGSDEAGKGDYFGPLVICSFVAHRNQFDELRKIGVRDSKLIAPHEIHRIAESLIKTYSQQFQVMKLMPVQYNALYLKFKNSSKNLNHLLAWAHARNILDLQSKCCFEGFIVDQFSRRDLISTSISDIKKINIVQKTKAESDVCVATASILARHIYVSAMEQMSHDYQFNFPLGAGNHVKQAILDFEKKFGSESLVKVMKMHFKI